MLEKYCDILVVGTELPGLITAAFLSRRGLSVQVVDSDFYSDHPHLPDPKCVTHAQSKLLKSIMGRLNVPEILIQNFLNQESNLQALFTNHRIDVLSNPVLYYDELEREFPALATPLKSLYEKQASLRYKLDINELYAKLIPGTWSERRAFSNFASENHLNDKEAEFLNLILPHPTLKAFFEAQYLLAYQTQMDNPLSYQVAELFNPSDGEVFSMISGTRSLKNLLIERIVSHDGLIRKKCSVSQLLLRSGTVEGIELAESQEQILARYMIWNAPLHKMNELVPTKWRYRSFKKSLSSFDTPWHWFSTRFSIRQEFIPTPMKRNLVVVQNPNQPLQGSNFLFLNVSETTRSGQCYIDVHFLLPKSALKEDFSFFEPYFNHIKNYLIKIMPFAQNELKRVFPLASDTESLDTLFPMNENDFDVFKFSAETNGVLQRKTETFLDLFPLHFKTPLPNLFISHPYVFCGLGLDSKLTLGLKITDLIWQEVEKDKKRAMKSERRMA